MDYKRRLGVALATGSLFITTLLPGAAFANVTVTISGNGVNSTNNATVVIDTSTNVSQDNNTDVNLNINSTAETGNNTANNNTGGNVTIKTGNATSDANTTVGGSTNNATVNNSCECNQTVNVLIKDNQQDSTNDVLVLKTHTLDALQKNKTKLNKTVWSKVKTGDNKANGNINATVNVTTGSGSSTVNTTVDGSSNTLNITP